MGKQGQEIDSLLVKLGLDTDEKSFKEAQAMFSGVTTKMLQFGATVGVGLGLRDLTFGFARAKDELGRFADQYGVTAQFVDELGFAFEQTGSQAEDAFSLIRRTRDLMRQTQWGEIVDKAFRTQGINPMMLQGVTDVEESIKRISDAVKMLSAEGRRVFLKDMGFSESDTNLFSGRGDENLRALLSEAGELSKVRDEMIKQAREFNQTTGRLSRSVGGLADEFSSLILDDFTKPLQEAADFLKQNNEEIVNFFREALPWIKRMATGIGLLVFFEAAKKGLDVGLPGAAGKIVVLGAAYELAVNGGQWMQENAPQYAGLTESVPVKSFFPEPSKADSGEGAFTMSDLLNGWDMMFSGMAATNDNSDNSVVNNNNVNIHVNGSANPQDVAEKTKKLVQEVLGENVSTTIRDIKTPVK